MGMTDKGQPPMLNPWYALLLEIRQHLATTNHGWSTTTTQDKGDGK